MSSLVLEEPVHRIFERPHRERSANPTWVAAVFSVGLHIVLFALIVNSWQPIPLKPDNKLTLLQTQLISLPPKSSPPPEPLAITPPARVEPPPVDANLEQAVLAKKRIADEKQRLTLEKEREQRRLREKHLQQQALERQQHEDAQRRAAEAEQQRLADLRLAQQKEAEARDAAARAAAQQAALTRPYLPINKSAPEYPERALEKGIEGDCTVQYNVNIVGNVENPRIVGSCHPLFIKPSLEAAKAFRYQPRVINGEAQPVGGVKNTFHYRIEQQ